MSAQYKVHAVAWEGCHEKVNRNCITGVVAGGVFDVLHALPPHDEALRIVEGFVSSLP